MVAARLINGHMKATEGTEIARILLNGWQFLKSTMRIAQPKGKLGYKEEVKDKCDRSHDHQFMKSVKEHTVCHTPCVQGNVVADHGVNHKNTMIRVKITS